MKREIKITRAKTTELVYDPHNPGLVVRKLVSMEFEVPVSDIRFVSTRDEESIRVGDIGIYKIKYQSPSGKKTDNLTTGICFDMFKQAESKQKSWSILLKRA